MFPHATSAFSCLADFSLTEVQARPPIRLPRSKLHCGGLAVELKVLIEVAMGGGCPYLRNLLFIGTIAYEPFTISLEQHRSFPVCIVVPQDRVSRGLMGLNGNVFERSADASILSYKVNVRVIWTDSSDLANGGYRHGLGLRLLETWKPQTMILRELVSCLREC